jgi:hypothetical protein
VNRLIKDVQELKSGDARAARHDDDDARVEHIHTLLFVQHNFYPVRPSVQRRVAAFFTNVALLTVSENIYGETRALDSLRSSSSIAGTSSLRRHTLSRNPRAI